RSVRKQYIVDKYKTRKYAVELDDANAVLRDAIDTLDMKKLLSAVVGGAEVNSLSADNCVLSRLTESADPMALPLVELLVQNGAGAARVSQILSACVERDHLDQLRLVLRAKAVGAGDRQTSLDIALKLGRTDCAKMLRAAMAGDRATLDRVSVPEELFGQRTRASTRTSTDEGSTTGTESSVASIERHSRNGSTGSQPRVALLPPKRPSSTGNQPPVPPLTAKPKLYHRSTSEYNESREVGLSKSFDEDDLGRRTLPGARRVLPLADGLGSVKLKPTATPPRSRPPLPPPKVAGHGGSSDTELSPPIPAPRSKAPQPTVLAQVTRL
uniref:Uncharacterized protein n=1 Tax=Plectus sambesii TaxID=2011161 RepID=A0A914UYP5_9BILA